MDQAEIDFRSELQAAVSECHKIGYRPNRFVGMINRSSPFEAVRSLLMGRDVSEGFTTLWEKGRLDLSVEAIALKPEWRKYFSPAELDTARRRLAEVNYQAPWDDEGTPSTGNVVRQVPTISTVPTVFPPVADAEAFVARIRSLSGLPERNHEDVVKDLLVRLGFDAASIVFQKGRIDLCVLNQDRNAAAVFEVKRTIAAESERAAARRQGMDYAGQTGAVIVVVTDGDRYEIYDRRKGHDYDAMLCGKFQLTAFRTDDSKILDLLRPANLHSVRG